MVIKFALKLTKKTGYLFILLQQQSKFSIFHPFHCKH